MSDRTSSSTRKRPHPFRPHAMRVAKFMLQSRAGSLLDLFDEIAAAWPSLSFTDFHGGFVLADILLCSPEQISPMQKGLPAVGDDPVKWLDQIIALASPTDIWGSA